MMAVSFDELVESLFYDVALAGDKGIDAGELTRAIYAFFESRDGGKQTEPLEAGDLLFSEHPSARTTAVDSNFVAAVWDWLVENPDIDIRADDSGTDPPPTTDTGTGDSLQPTSSGPPTTLHAGSRIFANEERVWQAIAGHGVDYKRIPQKEFQCLSVIAAHGSQGCLQRDVTRLTGQDKRSVPKRTDALSQKGYIAKESIISGGAKTALLKLKKFVNQPNNEASEHAKAYPQSSQPSGELDVVFYDEWYDKMMKTLLENNRVAALTDLRIHLGIHQDPWRTRTFRRCWSRLVESGCLRKIKAEVDTIGGFINCLQLLREPTDQDRMVFGAQKDRKLEKATDGTAAESSNAAAEAAGDDDSGDEQTEDGVDASAQLVSQWTPDIPYRNLISNIVESAGIEGISSMDLTARSMGTLWRRQVDELMQHLTESWNISQPPHLSHLGILRDSNVSGKYAHYSYRTRPNFEKAVKAGLTTWEAVTEGDKRAGGKSKTVQPSTSRTDAWGFPAVNPQEFPKDGLATLHECQRSIATHMRKFDQGEAALLKKMRHFEDTAGKSSLKQGKRSRKAPKASTIFSPAGSTPATEQELSEHKEPEANAFAVLHRPRLVVAQREIDQYAKNAKRLASIYAKAEAKQNNCPVSASRTKEIESDMLSREKPGVYLKPPGSKDLWLGPGGQRGRPPRNYLVVFKSPELHKFEWFSQSEAPRQLSNELGQDPAQQVNVATPSSGAHSFDPQPAPDEPSTEVASTLIEGDVSPNNAMEVTKPPVFGMEAPTNIRKRKVNDETQQPVEGQPPTKRGRTLDVRGSETRMTAPITLASTAIGDGRDAPSASAVPQGTDIAASSSGLSPAAALPKKRGRPSKAMVAERERLSRGEAVIDDDSTNVSDVQNPSKKRGRPSKAMLAARNGMDGPEDTLGADSIIVPSAPSVPKKRGRPSKAMIAERERLHAASAAGMDTTLLASEEQEQSGDSLKKRRVSNDASPRPETEEPQYDQQARQRDSTGLDQSHEGDRSHLAEAMASDLERDIHVEIMHANASSRHTPIQGIPRPETAEPETTNHTAAADYTEDLPEIICISPETDANGSAKRGAMRKFGGKKGVPRIQRENMILDIVRKCNGVFPGNREMWYPLYTAAKEADASIPDRNTVDNTLVFLCEERKLQRLRFVFMDTKGILRTSYIVIEPGIDHDSEQVRKTQRAMIDCHPHPYLPKEARIDPQHFSRSFQLLYEKMKNGKPELEGGQPLPSRIGQSRQEFPTVGGIIVRRTAAGIEDADANARRFGFENAQDKVRSRGPKPRKKQEWNILRSNSKKSTSNVNDDLSLSVGFEEEGDSDADSEQLEQSSRYKPNGHQQNGTFTGSDTPNSHNSHASKSFPGTFNVAVPNRGHSAGPNSAFYQAVERIRKLEDKIEQTDTEVQKSRRYKFVNLHLESKPAGTDSRKRVFTVTEEDLDDLSGQRRLDRTLADIQGDEVNLSTLNTRRTRGRGSAISSRSSALSRLQKGKRTSSSATTTDPSILSSGSQSFGWPLPPWSGESRLPLSHRITRLDPGEAGDDETDGDMNGRGHNSGRISKPYKSRKRVAGGEALNMAVAQFLPGAPEEQSEVDDHLALSFNTHDLGRICLVFALVGLLCHWEDDSVPPWNFVRQAMRLDADDERPQHAWNAIQASNEANSLMQQLIETLQETFIASYESDELGLVDFENPYSADWPGLMRWAEDATHMTRSGGEGERRNSTRRSAIESLPASDQDFRGHFDVGPVHDVPEYDPELYFDHVSEYMRTQVGLAFPSGTPFADTTKRDEANTTLNADHRYILVKSIARAITMTAEDDYKMEVAAQRITEAGSGDLREATLEMLDTKTLQQVKVDRQLPGRNFLVHRFAWRQFRRWHCNANEVTLFTEATAARTRFAQHFDRHNRLRVSEEFSEAENLVLANMVAQGHLRLLPVAMKREDTLDARPPTLSAWGWRGETVQDNKNSSVIFPLEYIKTAMFTSEDGLKRNVPIPLQPPLFPGEQYHRYPFWVDINGKLLIEPWQAVVRTILNFLVFRPGTTSQGIESALACKLWIWEASLALAWMEEVGIAGRFGAGEEVEGVWNGGWTAKEWWYCAFMPGVANPL